MKREDASYPVGILLAGFPSEPLEKETIELWTDEIQRLDDEKLAAATARRLVREEDRFPSLKAFLSLYGSEMRRRRDDGQELAARNRLALPAAKQEVPTWVWVWSWARSEGDDRPFPQQEGYVNPLKMMTREEYALLEQGWRVAGEPHRRLPAVHSLA